MISRLLDLGTFVRFLGAGVINTAFGVLLFATLQALIGEHRTAAALSAIAAILIGHTLTGRLAFASRGYRTLLPYAVLYAGVAAVNAMLIDLFVRVGFGPVFAQGLAAPAVALTSYSLNAAFVFRKPI